MIPATSDKLTLDKLLEAIQWETSGYKPKTEEQLQQQAQNRTASTYEQKRLSANQAYETSDLALQQQLAGLQATYDKQRQQSAENYAKAYSQADRAAVKRGMQRSSYNMSTLNNIQLAGAKAQQEIGNTQAQQENNINEQRALASRQLAQQLESYSNQQLSDTNAYYDELADKEYDRGVTADNTRNQLGIQLYSLQHQLEQEAQAQANWEAEFAAKYGGGGGGRGGGGGGSRSTATETPEQKHTTKGTERGSLFTALTSNTKIGSAKALNTTGAGNGGLNQKYYQTK